MLRRCLVVTVLRSNTAHIGIDPGAKGSGWVLSNGVTDHIKFDKSDDREILLWFLDIKLNYDNLICCIEDIHSQPTDGVVSAFSFGANVQRIKTILNLAGIKYEKVLPNTWMNYMARGKVPHGRSNYRKRKKALLAVAQSICSYGGMTLDNADGFLIAEYIRQTKAL